MQWGQLTRGDSLPWSPCQSEEDEKDYPKNIPSKSSTTSKVCTYIFATHFICLSFLFDSIISISEYWHWPCSRGKGWFSFAVPFKDLSVTPMRSRKNPVIETCESCTGTGNMHRSAPFSFWTQYIAVTGKLLCEFKAPLYMHEVSVQWVVPWILYLGTFLWSFSTSWHSCCNLLSMLSALWYQFNSGQIRQWHILRSPVLVFACVAIGLCWVSGKSCEVFKLHLRRHS